MDLCVTSILRYAHILKKGVLNGVVQHVNLDKWSSCITKV